MPTVRASATAILVSLLAAAVVLLPSAAAPATAPAPSLQQLVGQRLIVAFGGTTPSPALLQRVRRGEIGGVILFGANVTGPAQLARLTASLQAAARAGGQPLLLVATDQEGGGVRRLSWAGPALSASGLGRLGAAAIQAQAAAAGRALRATGVNVDLAPVADVPRAGSFMAAAARTFGTTPATVGAAVVAFVRGLADARVAATAKHFPGIGTATLNTDQHAVTLPSSEAALVPFRSAVAAGVPLVMISNATYPSLDSKPAPWSPKVQSLLRGRLGFRGVTISDALDAAAATRGRPLPSVAVLSAQAGVDLLLLVGSESSSTSVYDRLLAAAKSGKITLASLRRSYDRILALKTAYAPVR